MRRTDTDTITALGHRLRPAPFPSDAGRVWTSDREPTLGSVVSVLHKPWFCGTDAEYRAELALVREDGTDVRAWSATGRTREEAVAALRAQLRGSMLGAAA